MAKKKNDNIDLDDVFSDLAKETEGETLDSKESVSFFIDTGNLAINYSCSGKFITGGIPGNRITEAYGPEASGKSLIASNVLYGCQKLGGWAILIDCENASNAEFMEKISHLNIKRVLRYTPSSLEQAFRRIHVVTKKIREREKELNLERKPIVVVFDSLTVPPCERELRENNLPLDYSLADWKKIVGRQEQPGERARIIGAEMRKLQAMIVKEGVTVYLINQIRDKIGVLYGCHFGNSLVYLADGSTRKIKDIVKNKEELMVLSYNHKTKKIEPKKIIDWHDNGLLPDGENFLKVKFKRQHRNAFGYLQCTRNHNIFKYDENDEVVKLHAEQLKIGDNLVLAQPYYLSDDQWQIVYGSILGDGSVRRNAKGRNPHLRFSHGLKQEDYLRFKTNLMDNVMSGEVRSTNHNSWEAETKSLFELESVVDYKNDYLIPNLIANNLNELGLAIWYLDDGSYSGHHEHWGNGRSVIYCVKFKNKEIMLPVFEKLGLNATIFKKGFKFDSENTDKLHQLICRFVPDSMNYKIHPRYHGLYGFNFEKSPVKYETIKGEVLEIGEKITRSRRKYDIAVEDNANYITAGALVSNSPETTPGGKAVQFYSSLRFRTQAKKKIEQKNLNKFAGINMQIRNVKNRTHRPFVVADDIKLFFEEGIDPLSGLMTCLIESERIAGKGSYSVAEKYLPEGKTEYKFKAKLADNRISKQILLDCPKLIDANSSEEVEEYLTSWGSGLNASESGNYSERTLAFNVDGEPQDSEEELHELEDEE